MSEVKRHKMVRWYNPPQLLQTAGDVVISTVFGQNADQRLIEALFADRNQQPGEGLFRNYSNQEEFWLDYIADLGDGWNSTYAVAYYASQPKLQLRINGNTYDTVRGQAVIFGGDEVYPVASRIAYKERTFEPYDCAFNSGSRPDLFAIPGNHDWYDSLVSFVRYFIDKDNIAKFPTPQTRSYFAVKLPHGWWLLAADTQLGSYIDGPQVEYFKQVASKIEEGNKVILCNSEPSWIYEKVYGAVDPNADDRNLDYLENEILKGKRVRVFLAGDLHHYRRHMADDKTHKITAGGGGAFLHPTHGWDVDAIPESLSSDVRRTPRTFALKESWPIASESLKLSCRNLLFPILNLEFGIVPAFLYLMTAWSVMADVGTVHDIREAGSIVFHNIFDTPFPTFWASLIVFGFVFFTDTHVTWYRWTAGPLHGLLHLSAVFFIGWGVTYFAVSEVHLQFGSPLQLILSGLLIFGGGWLIGSFLMGLYLFISLNVCGRHMNEAFSSLRIQDWKHFLRLHIDKHGELFIYPIGIRRVPRRWTDHGENHAGPRFSPNDPRATSPELIEDRLTI